MSRTITVIVNPAGEIKIDAIGFKGADCEKATAYLETALGVIKERRKKPEYYSVKQIAYQKVGGRA